MTYELAGTAEGSPAPQPYIIGARYDFAWFLAPPLGALVVGGVLGASGFADERFWHDGRRLTYAGFGLGALVHAHLVAVLFRSHINRRIFKLYPVRFVVVPLVVLGALLMSFEALVCATVIVVFWDVYHSALQTFGLARIYEQRAGNAPAAGRRLDWGLNCLLYAGPIIAGATMLSHFEQLRHFEAIGLTFFVSVPAFMASYHRYFAWAVIVGGALYVMVYVALYLRLHRQGHRVSWPKLWLLASTGLSSIVTWGLNPWGQAFLIMNLFHALQYLALVWGVEHERVSRFLRLAQHKWAALLVFLGLVGAYGAWAELVQSDEHLFWSVTQVVALMHFWYDGFVWSVSRQQV